MEARLSFERGNRRRVTLDEWFDVNTSLWTRLNLGLDLIDELDTAMMFVVGQP